MHQTLYIDIDEEITSVVERLKKTKGKEVIMVVPKRALLIQSIVNLRLLKKEAENLGLQLMIVTQDKLGKLLVEKAGILVQQKLDDMLEEGEEKDFSSPVPQDNSYQVSFSAEEDNKISAGFSQKDRLASIGSAEYFDDKEKDSSEKNIIRPVDVSQPKEEKGKEERIINKELVTNVGSDVKKKNPYSYMDSPFRPGANNKIEEAKDFSVGSSNLSRSMDLGRGSMKMPASVEEKKQYPSQDEKITSFFQHPSENQNKIYQKPEKASFKIPKESKFQWEKIKKLILVAGALMVLAALGAGVYFYLPKAVVSIAVKEETKSQDADIRGDASVSGVDYENGIIPVKLISVNKEVSKSFSVSGKKSVSNQKARGTITIYNEFGSDSQQLVATTRFLSESGKLFRLVKGVTVPGTSKVGGETKPGIIEAEVVADEAGDDFNIEPTSFTIPGFKDSGSGKYSKFYAKSAKAMTGGGGTKDQVGVLTEADIAKAKTEILAELTESTKNKIKESAGGMVVLDEAVNNEEATHKVSNAVGEVVQNFQVTSQMKSNALVFSEEDLKKAVGAKLSKSGGEISGMNFSSLVLEYGKSGADFGANVLNIKVHGTGNTNLGFDQEKFKKDILGKSNEDFEAYLSSYPDIEQAEVTYWPPFISSRIPRLSSRVEIILDTKQ
ncbi:MAG TPA: hypothetical protein PLK35_03455 [Candidatus Moranbacteria bacterium]|nr:hypothetical protein [Candidatus Moranbacteria bacterium]